MKLSAPLGKLSLLVFLGSSFLQAGFYWALTIFIARNYSGQVLGNYSYILAIITPLFVLSSLQLRTFLITSKERDLEARLKWLRLIVPIASFTFGLLFILIFEEQSLWPYLLITLIKMGEIWSDLAYGIWQKHQGLKKVNFALCFRYLILLLVLIAASQLKTTFFVLLMTLAGLSVMIGAIDYFACGLNKIPVRSAGTLKIFLTTFSLSLSSLLTALLVNIPRYQLKQFFDVDEVGVFTLLFYYYVIPSMIINYCCQGLLKEFTKIVSAWRTIAFFLCGLVLISIGYYIILIAGGDEINKWLYNREIAWGQEIVMYITFSFLLGSAASFLHYALMALNIYHVQLKTNVLSAMTTLIIGFLLIPHSGIQGAFISFMGGLLVQLIVYGIIFSRIKL